MAKLFSFSNGFESNSHILDKHKPGANQRISQYEGQYCLYGWKCDRGVVTMHYERIYKIYIHVENMKKYIKNDLRLKILIKMM